MNKTMAQMSYNNGSLAIEKILNKYSNNNLRHGIIEQILFCVAKKEGVELANALIWKFGLYYANMGSHNWFDCEKSSGPTIIHRYPELILVREDLKFPTKKGAKRFMESNYNVQ
jgi:hypothetical protein